MSRKNMIRIGLTAAAVICIAAGICRGEAAEVFRKATTICYSCIGIG